MSAKYVIAPGWMKSRSDGELHYIGAGSLMRLYGVNPAECIIVASREDERGRDLTDLVWLHPRYDGDYSLDAGRL